LLFSVLTSSYEGVSCFTFGILKKSSKITRMPIILRIGSFRFFFYSNENAEPAHIHIQRENKLAKFWLKPVALASSTRFSPKELRKIQQLVAENKEALLEAWNEYFSH